MRAMSLLLLILFVFISMTVKNTCASFCKEYIKLADFGTFGALWTPCYNLCILDGSIEQQDLEDGTEIVGQCWP